MMKAQISDADHIQKFIFGGNSTFTLRSTKTDKHIAFKVRQVKDGGNCFFVRAHQGGVNGEGGFNYAGWMREKAVVIKKSKKSHADLDQARLALEWTLRQISTGEMPELLEFWHEGRCCRCNRRLTDPTSIELGIGPECRKK